MTKHQKNVENTGKEPDIPQNGVIIPQPLYEILLEFRDEYSNDDERRLLYCMLASCMFADEQDGHTYTEMLDLYDFFCRFTKALEDHITNEFDRKRAAKDAA